MIIRIMVAQENYTVEIVSGDCGCHDEADVIVDEHGNVIHPEIVEEQQYDYSGFYPYRCSAWSDGCYVW